MIDIQTKILSADAKGIADAARLLREGGLVAFPTETVYGLGADATNGQAVAGDFRRQGPSPFQSPDRACCRYQSEARRHAESFAPRAGAGGKFLARRADAGSAARRKNSPLSLLVSAGLDSVALRAPSHPAAIALLRETGRPVAGPSPICPARSPPPARSMLPTASAARWTLFWMAGSATLGLESTVIGFDGDRPLLLRPGAIAARGN